jgi:hypothetical protein
MARPRPGQGAGNHQSKISVFQVTDQTKPKPFPIVLDGDHILEIFQHPIQAEGSGFQLQFACLDFRKIKYIIDNAHQHLG